MKTVLILSPHFPPSSLAGVHRARHLAKWLPDHGWQPVIISADPASYPEPGDAGLASLLPETTKQRLTSALSTGFTRPFGIGDIGLRGFFGFARGLREAAEEHQASLLMITGSPFYPMLLAQYAQRNLDLPVLLDFQDPWVSVQGASRPYWSKGRFSHRLARILEPRALRHADFITSVSEIQNLQMQERYPWLETAMAAIPIGGDPEDFVALRAATLDNPAHKLSSNHINIAYVGTLLPRALPIMSVLFQALSRLLIELPGLRSELRFNFVGTSNQMVAGGDGRVMPIAREHGVDDVIVETPQRVSYLEALSLLANADGLLMIGSDEPHYTASKIYPNLMAARPFLSIFHRSSSAHEVLVKAGGGITCSFRSSGDLEDLVPKVSEGIHKLATAPKSLGPINSTAYAPYTAHAVAGQFARVFETARKHRSIRC